MEPLHSNLQTCIWALKHPIKMVEMPYSTQQCLRFPESNEKYLCTAEYVKFRSSIEDFFILFYFLQICSVREKPPSWHTVYLMHDLICCQNDAIHLFWIYFRSKRNPLFASVLCFYVTGLKVLLMVCFRSRWSTILITARSTTTYWNKHFSSDTCINSILVHLNMQNTYLSFCLAFFLFFQLEH